MWELQNFPKDEDGAMECKVCEKWFHSKCQSITKAAADLVQYLVPRVWIDQILSKLAKWEHVSTFITRLEGALNQIMMECLWCLGEQEAWG